MQVLRKGRYIARLTDDPADIRAAQALRLRCFRSGGNAAFAASDADAHDDACVHILVQEALTDALVCCFRLLSLTDGAQIGISYSARFYELSALSGFPGPIVEMGRFCIDPGKRDPDILRLAWGAMTRYVDDASVRLLFGCSSFQGTEAGTYLDTFALLGNRHLAPMRWRPRIKAPEVYAFARQLAHHRPDPDRALQNMPPLLRSYLLMGGWVSDHAVIDRDLGTMHVFTGLEIGAIPPARARLLRAVAAG